MIVRKFQRDDAIDWKNGYFYICTIALITLLSKYILWKQVFVPASIYARENVHVPGALQFFPTVQIWTPFIIFRYHNRFEFVLKVYRCESKYVAIISHGSIKLTNVFTWFPETFFLDCFQFQAWNVTCIKKNFR